MDVIKTWTPGLKVIINEENESWILQLIWGTPDFWAGRCFNRSQNFCVANLWIKHSSSYYADLQINLIPLRYPKVVVLCRDNFKLWIKH